MSLVIARNQIELSLIAPTGRPLNMLLKSCEKIKLLLWSISCYPIPWTLRTHKTIPPSDKIICKRRVHYSFFIASSDHKAFFHRSLRCRTTSFQGFGMAGRANCVGYPRHPSQQKKTKPCVFEQTHAIHSPVFSVSDSSASLAVQYWSANF